MKRVVLKKLKVKNFLSVGDEWAELDIKPGLTFITGHNHDKNSSNGVGKSALFTDSFFFALYGHTLRKLNKKEIANNITQKPCKSIISFDVYDNHNKDEYILTRQLSPSKMQLFKNGIDISQNIRETDNVIEKTINATSDIFKYAVIMTLNDSVGFMNQNKNDRRKFIESILNLGVFADMVKLHTKIISESKKDFEVANSRLLDAKRTLDQYEEQTKKSTERRQNKIKELNDRIDSNKEEINRLLDTINSIQIPDINKLLSNKDIIEQKQIELRQSKETVLTNKTQIEFQIQQHQKRINHIQSHGPSCDKCMRVFTDDDRAHEENELDTLRQTIQDLKDKLEKWNHANKEIETRINKCVDALKQINDNVLFVETKKSEKASIQSRIEQLQNWNDVIEKDMSSLNVEDDNFVEAINDISNRVNDLQQQTNTESEKIEILEIVRFLLSEEGIKKFIVKKILKLLNSRLSHYLKALNAPCTCIFDDVFEEKIVNDKGVECSYESFSGGERKRIDLAMLFTFQDIRRLQSNTTINISVYDELIDSALSSEGVLNVLEMLKERSIKYNEAMYIITHRKENTTLMNDSNVIHLEKKNGITELKMTETCTI
jgi:DNA repair exonuclease SbcCD ATPase subunit